MAELYNNLFQPSNLSKGGFLGNDGRPIEEIIQADRETLERLGSDHESVAAALNEIMDAGKAQLEGDVEIGGTVVSVRWDRGMLPCPFGESGLHPKICAEMRFLQTGKKVCFSQLSIHLIRKHGFFGGKGSSFRLEPEELLRLIH
jgi:hypothetical protein